jgi:hypothetical protein
MDISKLSVSRHHLNVRALPCVLTGRRDVTLHHCHGGSLKERGWALNRPRNQALVIPIVIEFHSIGPNAIDGDLGVVRWEERFGTQAQYLDEVGELLGYSLWELAESWRSLKSAR